MRSLIAVAGMVAVVSLLAHGTAEAVSNIDPGSKWAWGENIGWTNWRDAGTPPADSGVVVSPTFLSGWIWAENIGWISVGHVAPTNGVSYSNTGSDIGVNVEADGDLAGWGWSENHGWINFGWGAPSGNALRAKDVGGVFYGYVWSENRGWILLGSGTARLSTHPPGVDVTPAPAKTYAFALEQNGPNPFTTRTTIRFELPEKARARLEIFDPQGRRLRSLVDGMVEAGPHSIEWDHVSDGGEPVAPGVYFYRLEAGSRRAERKLVLLK